VNEENGNAQDAKRHLSVVKSMETTSSLLSTPQAALLTGTPILNGYSLDRSNLSVKDATELKQRKKIMLDDLKEGDKVRHKMDHSPVYGKVGTIKSFPYDGLAWVEFGVPGEEYGISVIDLERVTEMTGSMKKDDGKYDPTMLTLELVELLSRVRMFGAKKYARNNFKITGFKYTRSCAAALRHIFAFLNGEDNDPESGLSHLGHAVASLEHCIYDLKNHPENDDRKG
jgi:hypothetical protein